MKTKLFAFVATTALLAGLPAAQAAIVTVTYAGAVSYGWDSTGRFNGGRPTSLFGDSYQAVYTFDTTQGITGSGPFGSFAKGGPALLTNPGSSSPSLGVAVTVNGYSVSTAGNSYGVISASNNLTTSPSYSSQIHIAENDIVGAILSIGSAVLSSIDNPSFTLPTTIDAPFTYIVGAGDTARSTAEYASWDTSTGYFFHVTEVGAKISTITERVAGISGSGPTIYGAPDPGVPEPSTWAMMFLGFAGVGFAAWRQNRKGAAEAAG